LDTATRKKLERLALERLAATRDDEEQWSFLFRTEGAGYLNYCPWSVAEEEDFDPNIPGLSLPWTPERLEALRRGEADPDEEELRQWRQALCLQLATSGSDWCSVAWLVPLAIDRKIAGYALFLCEPGDADETPRFAGVFDCAEDAEAALDVEGAVDRGRHP